VIGLAIVGTHHGDGGGGGTTVANTSGSGALDARPSRPNVSVAKQKDGQFKFTWTWPAPAANYYAQWHTQAEPAKVRSVDGTQPAQLILAAKTAGQCIVVVIVRRTDGTYSDPSEPVCGT
jgi:hypothetical protein